MAQFEGPKMIESPFRILAKSPVFVPQRFVYQNIFDMFTPFALNQLILHMVLEDSFDSTAVNI